MNVPQTDRTLRQCLIVHLTSYKRPPCSDAVKTLVSHTAFTDVEIHLPLLCLRIGASPDCEHRIVNRVAFSDDVPLAALSIVRLMCCDVFL